MMQNLIMSNNNGRSGNKRKTNNSSGRRTNNSNSNRRNNNAVIEEPLMSPLMTVIITLLICVLIFLSNIGILGSVGDVISKGVFGVFGMPAYILPILAVVLVFALYSVSESPLVLRRVVCSVILYILISTLIEMLNGVVNEMSDAYNPALLWENGSVNRKGGGIIFGSLAYVMNRYLSHAGTIALLIIFMLICIGLILGREVLGNLSQGGMNAIRVAKDRSEEMRESAAAYRERHDNREAEEEDVYDEDLPRYARKRRGIGVGIGSVNEDKQDLKDEKLPKINGEELPDLSNTPRRNKKVSGVADIKVGDNSASSRSKGTFDRDDIHEITVKDISDNEPISEKAHAVSRNPMDEYGDITFGKGGAEPDDQPADDTTQAGPAVIGDKPKAVKADSVGAKTTATLSNADLDMKKSLKKSSSKAYKMPSLNLLNDFDSDKKKGSSKEELLDTAKLLANTLETFGVNAKITDISQGPSVTRFELQPEVGVRVNKIVSLADDIKLSLAATDIRIEAPIPGKSAVGIEVPNKVSTGVGLRELLNDKVFKEHESKICFAVGKDIAGKTIVADIAKMPHMLIAGATGSGKSVCINTIIMSILYKAHPDDVKLIMIDPKVVELSVYNGIPHLMVPVVTDPKKAAAALNWGVAEMTERYKKFADLNVRDLKGYNKKIDELISKGQKIDEEGNEIYRLPQIVIIVDELADLMMVAAKEVEESICRLAQLARACGIHLIIATQRPSVDVITGLIKANMPSRVAFAVSSGVDSRTILDMNGAEKLLGKGDMLFFPQGYPKPARIQGAFVSDAEVASVVKFLKDQDYVGIGIGDIENKISNMTSASSGYDSSGADELDDLFADAGRFIISQDKASIGSLQRKFKIGFNRAARIMDQLSDAGVVSEDNGTKPREIIMSPEQFEQYIEECV